MKNIALLLALFCSVRSLLAQSSTKDDNSKEMTYYGDTASLLLDECRFIDLTDRPPDHLVRFHSERCVRYIAGVIDGVEAANAVSSRNIFFCVPDTPVGPSERELAKVVIKFGDDHPEFMHKSAIVLVVQSLARAYPCPAT